MPFSSDLPDPPVPADLNLRALPYYPLNYQRLIGSSFHRLASLAEWKAGLLLWMKSWHEIPAGSLPGDDRELCVLAEVPMRAWLKLKDMALHGWALHSDGRLYHPVVTEVTLHASGKLAANRHRTQAALLARQTKQRDVERDVERDVGRNGQRNVHQIEIEEEREALSDKKEPDGSFISERGSCPNGHSLRARGALHANPRAKGTNPRQIGADFEGFWMVYPRKVGKQDALRKYEIARRSASKDEILYAAIRYADAMAGAEKQYVAHPSTWLHQGRWQDEDVEVQQRRKSPLEKLYEGAWRAANELDEQEQAGDSGEDSGTAHPLLDRR